MSTIKPFDPFRSERLVYRAVNDGPEDEAFVHAIQRDAEAQSGSSYGLLRPESIKNSNEFKEQLVFSESLIRQFGKHSSRMCHMLMHAPKTLYERVDFCH